MSTTAYGRVLGPAAIVAGLVWLAGAAGFVTGSESLLSGTLWDAVAALAAALILLNVPVLYRQGNRSRAGTVALVVLAIGSAGIMLSHIGYLLQITFDPDEGLRFFTFVFGTIIQGLGLAAIGYAHRSRGEFAAWRRLLTLLGLIVALGVPAVFVYHFAVTERHTELLFGIILVAQALAWVIVGAMTVVGSEEAIEGTVPSTG